MLDTLISVDNVVQSTTTKHIERIKRQNKTKRPEAEGDTRPYTSTDFDEWCAAQSTRKFTSVTLGYFWLYCRPTVGLQCSNCGMHR